MPTFEGLSRDSVESIAYELQQRNQVLEKNLTLAQAEYRTLIAKPYLVGILVDFDDESGEYYCHAAIGPALRQGLSPRTLKSLEQLEMEGPQHSFLSAIHSAAEAMNHIFVSEALADTTPPAHLEPPKP